MSTKTFALNDKEIEIVYEALSSFAAYHDEDDDEDASEILFKLIAQFNKGKA